MSVRTSINLSAEASPSSTARSVTGRAFIVGRSSRGPLVPTSVFGPAEFVAKFGARSATNQQLHDAAMAYFANGGAEAVVVRAAGPAPVKATATLTGGGNSLVVTAKDAGAWGNTISAAYDSASKTLSITADGAVETFSGADLAGLLAKAVYASAVTVTSPSEALPTANVAATSLATGADDFSNANLATLLDLVPATWGPGVVLVPGTAHSEPFAASASTVGVILAAHCAKVRTRVAMVSSPASVDSATAWELDKRAIQAYSNSDLLIPVWPSATVNLTVGTAVVTAVIDPTSIAAGRRAAAHAIGPWVSPIREGLRELPSVADVAVQLTDDEALLAFTTGGVLLRKEYTPAGALCVIASWNTASAPAGDVKKHLLGAQHRDLSLAVCYDASVIGSRQEGRTIDGQGDALSAFEGALKGMLEHYVSAGALYAKRLPSGTVEPAYVVDTSSALNTTESIASGRMRATIRQRQSAVGEYVDINIVAGDAGLGL